MLGGVAATMAAIAHPAFARQSEHGDISRVRRGGCWSDEGWPCRSAFRVRFEPERRYDHIGFRGLVIELR
jgi:formylglycine-generating enzyme required for sulfatase activity